MNVSRKELSEDKKIEYDVLTVKMIQEIEEILKFNIAVKYFSENANDYLWLDSLEWTYSAKEIQKLAQIPYNSEWLYNKII